MATPNSHTEDVSALLRSFVAGEVGAEAELFRRIYGELHAIAASLLVRERAGHTLTPTALVHEAYLRLVGSGHLDPDDRTAFLGIAAHRMRQVLVDHARTRDSAKRGGPERRRISLNQLDLDQDAQGIDAIELDQALRQLEEVDARKVKVVELRYFAGLEMAEIAVVLKVSRATVNRDWEVARAFLYQALR